jgi:site-specific DNA-methyltransferase (adenine-specific)
MTQTLPAPRNRTLTLSEQERRKYASRLLHVDRSVSLEGILNRTICQDVFSVLPFLPRASVDLLFADPPYNLNKTFNQAAFASLPLEEYETWLESWLVEILPILKPTASVYVCGDWRSSSAVHRVCDRHLSVRNRITWEREKGRGAETNWKNCSEDIWFCTVGRTYWFDVNSVKLRRRTIAPYTDANGRPKGWEDGEHGRCRLTHPSNLWTDLTVPFWSMPENTNHPTQKPEKLLAKVLLASSRVGDVVFDPFLGSGTSSVVAKKLQRKFFGIEIDPYYCCLAEKRLDLANEDRVIQGYNEGVFWERNTLSEQRSRGSISGGQCTSLFEDVSVTGYPSNAK